MKNHKVWSIVKNVIKKEMVFTITFLVVIAGSICFALIPPLMLEQIVNQLISSQQVFLNAALLYFAWIGISGLFDAAKEVMITIFGQKITKELRYEMCCKLTRIQSSYFTGNETGKIASRFMNDVDAVESLFHNGIISMIVDVGKVVSIIIVIFIKSKGLGMLMLFVTPMLFLLTRHFQKRMLKAQKENRIAIEKVNNHVPETIENIRMIHSFYKQDYMAGRYDDYIEESYEAMEKSNLYDSIYSPIVIFISSLVISLMMILAAMGDGMQSFFGITVGTAVAIISYVGKVFDPLESIGMEIQNIQSAVAGLQRIDELLKEEERERADRKAFPEGWMKGSDCILFDQVTFGYVEDQKILENFSCRIQSGENVTFIGRTGAGKSTAFRLLLGLYPPQKGRVQIFGKDAKDIPNEEKRKVFGYVEQSFQIVSGTIADQVSLFDKSISREKVEEAMKLVGLHETVMALDEGYDTKASENLFSQGQLQLLSIARAIVGEPVIMLLDEITANLDSATEQHMIQALEKSSKNRTVVSISHRLYEQKKNDIEGISDMRTISL